MKMDTAQEWQDRYSALRSAVEETGELAAVYAEKRIENVKELIRMENLETHFDDPDELYGAIHEGVQLMTSLDMLGALHQFSERSFDFFLRGYYTGAEHERLPVSDETPPRFVMRTILTQISHDLNILQQVLNQRERLIDSSTAEGESGHYIDGRPTTQGRALYMADRLAHRALMPAIQAGLLPVSTTVLSYLGRHIRARLVPYYDVVLFSVAFGSVQQAETPSRDYIAIPHEIGHHIYWNGNTPDKKQMPVHKALAKRLSKAGLRKNDWRRRWVEEVFCDIYALLIGGPVVALDFQDMLDDDEPTHFREDSDQHPIPELRALFHTEILKRIELGGQPAYPVAAEKLEKNWIEWLDVEPRKEKYRLSSRKQMTGEKILDAFDPVFDVILDMLGMMLPEMKSWVWSFELKPGDGLQELYNQFQKTATPDSADRQQLEEVRMMVKISDKMEAIGSNDPAVLAEDERKIYHLIEEKHRRTNDFEERMRLITGDDPTSLGTADWMELFLFQGWSDEGPTGSSGGRN